MSMSVYCKCALCGHEAQVPKENINNIEKLKTKGAIQLCSRCSNRIRHLKEGFSSLVIGMIESELEGEEKIMLFDLLASACLDITTLAKITMIQKELAL